MAPTFNEFEDERALAEEVQSRISQGTSKDNLYVLSHDDDRTERVADKTEASVPDELEGSIAARYNKKAMSSVLFCTTSVFQNKKVAISKKNSTVAESCW